MPGVVHNQRAELVPILDLADETPTHYWRQRIAMRMHGIGSYCKGFGYFANTLSGINPAKVISTILSPTGPISVPDMWCRTIRIGCRPDRDAVFRTGNFENLKRPHPSDQISIGTDYFDCLDDLRILRQQEFATSHLATLAGRVMSFEHLLAAPEDLLNNVDALAKTWKDVLLKANAARVHGTNGINKIIDEFPRILDTTSNMTTAEVSNAFSPARDDFATAASFILTSAQAVKKAQELTTLVSQRAHREMNGLRKIRNDEESGWAYLAPGWTRFIWNYLQPGLVGRKQHSDEAAQFLVELIKVVDESDSPMTRNEMSLQQCAIDIAHFSRQVDRDFSLEEPSETLSIGDQLTKLVPRIESLQSKLVGLRRKDQAARLVLSGAPPLSLLPAGSWLSLKGEGAEQGRGPQCLAGLV
ncbi:hypothetical protein FRC00_007114 [Tulasnella sp. 408]|nr:hypothetical protein FRC00_007114 [Tulasnella sp. 408]